MLLNISIFLLKLALILFILLKTIYNTNKIIISIIDIIANNNITKFSIKFLAVIILDLKIF